MESRHETLVAESQSLPQSYRFCFRLDRYKGMTDISAYWINGSVRMFCLASGYVWHTVMIAFIYLTCSPPPELDSCGIDNQFTVSRISRDTHTGLLPT